MSELNEHEEQEIVDLDTCSRKKSILIASGITVLLGFVGYSYIFLCIHYVLGGIAASGHFAKRHSISFSSGTGAKLGALAAFFGMLPILALIVFFLYTGFGETEFEQVREEIVRTMYEDGNPEAAEFAEKAELSELKPGITAVVAVLGTSLSLLLGSIGGVIGANLFKKGPEAR
ncbi:hypothetical protein VDG1235_2886 [Verrucomicrobiia bacterium DG1235]|nr:hypothetical protein VDG1235_2886 [Verrucomicrobiae bacterium DG1235]